MQQQQNTNQEASNKALSLELKEITEILVKHFGLHDGKYDISIEFNVGVGAVGPTEQNRLPGAMIAVSRIGIAQATQDGPATVNASEINPKPAVVSNTRAKTKSKFKEQP
jgi:hypothetical protein